MTQIKVIYREVPGSTISIDAELDKKIQAFFETLGFKWISQGFDLKKEERDIGFESESYRLCSPLTS